MTEATTHSLRITRTFQAPRGTVFKAFTDPDILKQWWGPQGFTTPAVAVDLRVGGEFRYSIRREDTGELMHFHGRYLEVDPPQKLSYTRIADPGDGGHVWKDVGMADLETRVTLDFIDHGQATEVVMVHSLFPTEQAKQMHERGWASTFDCLDNYYQLSHDH